MAHPLLAMLEGTLFLLAPAGVYLLLIRWIYESSSHGLRHAIVSAAVLWGALLVVITEALSSIHAITRIGLAAAWLGILIGVVIFYKRRRSDGTIKQKLLLKTLLPSDKSQRLLLGGIGAVISFVGVIGIVSPPNTWDSMDYHLPRVIQWMGNRDVQNFPTLDFAQLVHGPWAEYAMLHFTLLWGNDRFVNMVEWASFIGSIIGVSLIAKCLGAGRWGQLLAAVVCVTIPQGILEASGAKNLYVISFWAVAFVYLILLARKQNDWFTTASIGLAAGLAVLTKGLAYLILPSFVVLCFLWSLQPLTLWFRRIAVVACLATLLNTPQSFRNYQSTGSPLGQPVRENGPRMKFAVDRISVRGIYASVLRNMSLHCTTPLSRVNETIQKVFVTAIRAAGVDPDDPATTWRGFVINTLSGHEIRDGNPIHFVLLLAVILYIFCRPRSLPEQRATLYYTLAICGAFLFVSILLKWNQWSSRYHLPIFVLGAVLPALIMERLFTNKAKALAATTLLVCALPFVVWNQLRPLLPLSPKNIFRLSRTELYFVDQHDYLLPSFLDTAAAIRSMPCTNIGVDTSLELYIYPLLKLMGADTGMRAVQYTSVTNSTARFRRQPPPCAVICVGCAHISRKYSEYASFGRASTFGDTVVFSQSGSFENKAPSLPPQDTRSPTEILASIDRERSQLFAIDTGPTFQVIAQAERKWPERKRELQRKLAMATAALTRATNLDESLEPQRRDALIGKFTTNDYQAVLVVEEAFRVWRTMLPQELSAVQESISERSVNSKQHLPGENAKL